MNQNKKSTCNNEKGADICQKLNKKNNKQNNKQNRLKK